MKKVLANLTKLQKEGCKSINDLEEIFGELDISKQRSRKFGKRNILAVSKRYFAISRNTIVRHQKEFGNDFFLIALDWKGQSRLFCFPFWEFADIIEKEARIGYGTASYNQNSYIFGFNLDNSCTWGGTRLDTSSYIVPHHEEILFELGLRKKPVKPFQPGTVIVQPTTTPIKSGYLIDLIELEYTNQFEEFLAGNAIFSIELENFKELIEEDFVLLVIKEKSEVFVGRFDLIEENKSAKLVFSTLTSTKLDRSSLNTLNQKISGTLIEFYDGIVLKKVEREIFDELIKKYGAEYIGIQNDLDWESIDFENLRYSNEESLKKRVSAIINSGHNLIITGDPGVGKTALAEKIGDAAQRSGLCSGVRTITGTSDWTSFETIGGLLPVNEEEENKRSEFSLKFVEGLFLQSIRENRWLIIDEINRCDIDKVFGPLFTVFSENRVELPYKKNGKTITIAPIETENSSFDKENCVYEVGMNWRILGTMNEADKSALYDLSFAFMRRFAFLRLFNPSDEIIIDVLKEKADESVNQGIIPYIVKLSDLESRKIGISILIAILEYMVWREVSAESFIEAIDAFIIPQLEGFSPHESRTAQNKIEEIVNSVNLFFESI